MIEELLSLHHIAVLAPEIVLALFAMAVMLAGAFFPDALQRRILPLLALAGVVVSGVSVVGLWGKGAVFGCPSPTGCSLGGLELGPAGFAADDFSLLFKWIFLLGLGATVLISSRFLTARAGDSHTVSGEYYALLMLSTVGMMMVASARDLLVVFLGIETLSIALYVLAGFARTRLASNEAALKYFLLGAFATGFLLYGIALIYAATGQTSLARIGELGPTGFATASPHLLHIGMALLLIGLGFKAALVPFHQWTPDVYEGSPTPVTAFMAVGAKAAAFAALLRVFPGAFGDPANAPLWHDIVLVMAVLTMTFGNVVAVAQSSLKRMLAYSSIAHAGYALIGVLAAGPEASHDTGAPGVGSAVGSVVFYLIVYAIMNLGAFAALVYFESAHEAKPGEVWDVEDANLTVDDLRGSAARHPLAAAAFTVFLLSLAGIPPLAGFFGKLYIFQAAMRQGLYGLLIVAVLNTVISVYFYLRPVIAMYLPPGEETAPVAGVGADGAAVCSLHRSLTLTATIAVCALVVLAMCVLQMPILDWVGQAAVR